ncbi:MAG: methyltransferase domain-containing protein [Acidobacteria bacterium]|nr:methyltransferase domain-containing protein [Acidobacteriota bacterium]
MRARQFRRLANRLFVDRPESVLRRFKGRSHWPPLSLRRWVGSWADFDADGRWLIDQLSIRDLLPAGAQVLDVGCGCGRLAMALARDPRVAPLGLRYHGLDVDKPSIEWCRRHIGSEHDGFDFEHVGLRNRSYNPSGPLDAATYRFPFADFSFDLVVAASLFTHLVAAEMEHYLGEMARLLAGRGTLWATFFLFGNPAAPPDRHPVDFPHRDGKVAFHSQREPENAVSFAESYVLEVAAASGLELAEPIAYGPHDHLFFKRAE